MHSKSSFSLKSLTDYCNPTNQAKHSDNFSLPTLPNPNPSQINLGKMKRHESKIELNRNLSLFQCKLTKPSKKVSSSPKHPPKTPQKPSSNPPLAPRLNVNSNFYDKRTVKKSSSNYFDRFQKSQKAKKLNLTTNPAKPHQNPRKTILNSTIEVFKNSKLKENPKLKDPIHVSRKNINEYFDTIIKQFGLEEVQLSGKNEFNTFDLYLDNEL